MTVGDLEFWLHQADAPPLADTCRLWLTETGDAEAFAWATPGCIDVAVLPSSWHLLPEMMDWAEDFLAARGGRGAEVATSALETDTAHEEELRRRGYRRTDVHHQWYRSRSLKVPILREPLPAGCTMDTVAGARAWAALASLIDRTGASPSFSAAGWRDLMESPVYRPELDLVALAPDGRPIAHCTAWLDEHHGTLLLEPLGCDPEHRRRGLARALVGEALRRGREAAATLALVASDGANEAANATYSALGFAIGPRKWTWKRVQ